MIRNWLRNLMTGRYGPDQLNAALLFGTILFYLLEAVTGIGWLVFIAYFLLILSFYRMMSRNIPRRRAENDRFLRYWWPVRQKLKGFFQRLKQRRDYRFFRCPACGNMLRVPRGKGKIMITCPKCGERFQKKS